MKLIYISLLVALAVFPARSVTTCGGASPCSIQKTPFEKFVLSVDFTQVIGTDAFTLDSVVATNRVSGQDSTSAIIAASPAPAIVASTDKVAFAVNGGVKGATYIVGVRVTKTATSEKFEGQITLVVQ